MADKNTKYGNYDAVEKKDGTHVVPGSAPSRPSGGTRQRVEEHAKESGKSAFEKLKDMVRKDGNLAEDN